MGPIPPSDKAIPARNSFAFLPFNPWAFTLLACFILAALFGSRLIDDSDLGFHLKSGQWILKNHQILSKDINTYTVPGHSYLDMNWLYQTILYSLYRLGDYRLLSIFNICLVLTAFFITFCRLRLVGAALWMSALLLSATLLAGEFRFRMRPEVVSWVLMSLTLWVLELRAERRGDFLFALPLIQLVWVNTEGLFGIGWALMGFYVVSDLVHSRERDKKLLYYSLTAFACGLVNPFFHQGFFYPLSQLLLLGGSNPFKNSFQELQSPWFSDMPILSSLSMNLWIYKVFAFLLLLLLAMTFRRRKLHDWLLGLSFFVLSTCALRNIPLFMIACLPLAASCWKDWDWAPLRKFQDRFLAAPVTAWLLALFLLGFGFSVATNNYYIIHRRMEKFGWGLDTELQPLGACQFMAQNQLNGKILNSLNTSGWLDWQGSQPTFIDGRLELFGEKTYSEYMASMIPGGLDQLARQTKADIILFNILETPEWIPQLRNNLDWQLVYLDDYNAVYLQKGYSDVVPELDYDRLLAERGVSKSIVSEASQLLQTPVRTCSCLSLLRPLSDPRGLSNLGLFALQNNRLDIAEPLFLEAIRRTGGSYSDLYYDLGFLYWRFSTKRPEAILCMRRVLAEQPRNKEAARILRELSPEETQRN